MVKDLFQLIRGATILLAIGPTAASGAAISEVFFADLPGSPVPDAVELDGLSTLGQPQVDLVVLGASPNFGPIIWQVVTIPTVQDLLLVGDEPWPAGLWFLGDAPATHTTLADLGAAGGWSFGGSRTLVLFDRKTNLVANLQPLSTQTDRLNGASPVDWLTFQRGGAATAWDGEAVLDTADGYAITRPYTPTGDLWAPFIGTADSFGHVDGTDPPYPLTPGWRNPVSPAPLPEPGAIGPLLAALALFCALRRPIITTLCPVPAPARTQRCTPAWRKSSNASAPPCRMTGATSSSSASPPTGSSRSGCTAPASAARRAR